MSPPPGFFYACGVFPNADSEDTEGLEELLLCTRRCRALSRCTGSQSARIWVNSSDPSDLDSIPRSGPNEEPVLFRN